MKTLTRNLALGLLLASTLSLSGCAGFPLSSSAAVSDLLATTKATAACSYQPISYGQTVNGSLSTTDCVDSSVSGDISYADYYQFTATAGDKIYIQLSSSSIDPWLMLIYPSGNYASDNNGGGGTTARIPATSGYYSLPESGTYTIVASTYYYDASTGSYALMLAKEGSPASSALGSLLTIIEYYNSDLKHYFMTSDPLEAVGIDQGAAGPGWSRTGYSIKAYSRINPPSGTSAVCRFYGTPGKGPNSHFFTASAGECAIVKQDPGWFYEGIPFYVQPKNGTSCPAGTFPLYRAYNNRFAYNDSNHRFSTDYAVYQQMIANGWVGEGMVMCVNAASSSGSQTEREVRQMVDDTLSIITGAGGSGVTALFSDIFSALSNPSSTCPQATSNPPLTGLQSFPPSLTISANYGTGCTSSTGSSMSGSATLALSNLAMSQASSGAPINVSGNFSLTLNKVKKNGVLLGNGQLTGDLNLAISLSSSSGQSSGTANIQFTNLVLSTGTLINGTVSLAIASNTQQNSSVNITTSAGPVILSLQLTENSSGAAIMNTTSAGTVRNYSTQISNLQLSPKTCANYPVGGTITFAKGGQTSTVTFNASCDGSYNYVGP